MLDAEALVSPSELKNFLRVRRWNHGQLAEVLGIDRGNVSRWASGSQPPKSKIAHRFVRFLMQSSPSPESSPKKAPGAPLKNARGFKGARPICPDPQCQRTGERQMFREGLPRNHNLLGKIQSFFCDGSHSKKHKRVTLAMDLKGRIWNLGDLPHRKELAPFERRALQRARRLMGKELDRNALVKCLRTCSDWPSAEWKDRAPKRPGCGSFLCYDGRNQSSNALRARLHVFYCNKPACYLQWYHRLFDASGQEVPRNSPGGDRSNFLVAKIRVPPGAKLCPVCGDRLFAPKKILVIGGERFSHPLIRLLCHNERGVDHSPAKRKELGLPAGSRLGLSFYYSTKKSDFVEIYVKANKPGRPMRFCPTHGRMRISALHGPQRVPKQIFAKLGARFPIFRALCAQGDLEIWISADEKKSIRRSLPRWSLPGKAAAESTLQTSANLSPDGAALLSREQSEGNNESRT